MTRTPLRPLARILAARSRGENPDAIERENRRLRHESRRDRDRQRAESRIVVVAVFFLAGFVLVGLRMGVLAASDASEPRAEASAAAISSTRADIVDREGRVLATNLATYSLYAHPEDMIEPRRAARELAGIFPELDAEALERRFTDGRKFLWVRKTVSPEQRQAVHDIGEPGLLFGPREMRLYPNGRLAAHILGGASFGREGVHSAEVIGVAGIEKAMDERLRDPALAHEPLRLSIDLTVQSAMKRVLEGGMKLMNAKGAAAVLMDARTGEVAAMLSLPDFDPNDRPSPQGQRDDSPLFNRAVQGVYELGSALKIITVAQAMEEGLVSPSSVIDTKGPLTWGRFRISDFRNYGPALSVTDVIVKSSNIGTARIAMQIGAERQQAFLKKLGFLDPTPVELVEAAGAAPLLPPRWSEISTMTISYGHGLSISPLHLAAGYATLLNGGRRVTPTLLAQDDPPLGERVVSEEVSRAAAKMLRQVVTRGTASFAEVEGYMVGGKTGTADKPKPSGGYYDEKVLATFASVFPAHDPQWVLVVSLDEPVETSGDEPRRTAGWTTVPVAAELIRRVAPLLGLRPIEETEEIALIGGGN